jgi:hypothetical protein
MASFGSLSALAMIIGTAIAPTYITSTCWKPSMKSNPGFGT